MSDTVDPTGQSQHRQISDAIVRIIRQQTGRGPVSCRVTIDGNAVYALLHETLTKGEQTLLDNGHAEAVLTLRRAFQQVSGPSFISEVERITGRRVESFMSTNHTIPDRACEIFLLAEPLDQP